LTKAETDYLRIILTHWSGWSATDPDHLHDPWVQFIQALFPHVEGLMPVLDSLVWPEEVARMPPGSCPRQASLFLLANAHSFYVFQLDGLGMWCAGQSLEEVYIGLKESRFIGDEGDDWTPESMEYIDQDERDYFLSYIDRNGDGMFSLANELQEFPASVD
jgi:hypothetical protein